MAIDAVNKLSTEQLMALSMMGNGQVTNDSNSTSDSINDETNLSFELMMKNLMESQKKTTENAASAANGEVSQSNAAKVIQQYAAGQNLEDLPMILNSGYVMYNRNISNYTSSNRSDANMQEIYDAVNVASKKYGVNKDLILAIIKQESDFNSNDTSSCGAAGLMQIMPGNFSATGITDPYDINQNINGGTKLFKEYLDQYNGNVEMALMAYNGGPGTMQSRGVSSASDLYKMPKETQNYVPKVMGYYKNGV